MTIGLTRKFVVVMDGRLFLTIFFTFFFSEPFFHVKTALGNPVGLLAKDEPQADGKQKYDSLFAPTVLKSKEYVHVEEGDSVTLPCNIVFDDIIHQVRWYKEVGSNDRLLLFVDQSPTTGSDVNYSILKDFSLVIKHISPETAGKYMCALNEKIFTKHVITYTGAATKNTVSLSVLVTVFALYIYR